MSDNPLVERLERAAEQLPILALWFDVDDQAKGRSGDDQVQRDLRQWAFDITEAAQALTRMGEEKGSARPRDHPIEPRQTANDLEAFLALARELAPFADRRIGSLRIDVGDVRTIQAVAARLASRWQPIEGKRQPDPAGFVKLVQDNPGFWAADFPLKYLNITIDTRDPAVFWLADRDNNPIKPQRVLDAIEHPLFSGSPPLSPSEASAATSVEDEPSNPKLLTTNTGEGE